MNPWFVFWAPQLQLPFSGSVAQRIEPNTSWFFDSIAPSAGDATIERRAFDVASYGRQLGLIAEVLVDIARQLPPDTEQGRDSLRRLETIQRTIEALKAQDADALVSDAEAKIALVKRKYKAKLPQLRRALDGA